MSEYNNFAAPVSSGRTVEGLGGKGKGAANVSYEGEKGFKGASAGANAGAKGFGGRGRINLGSSGESLGQSGRSGWGGSAPSYEGRGAASSISGTETSGYSMVPPPLTYNILPMFPICCLTP